MKTFETERLSGSGKTGMAGNDSDMMLFSFFGHNPAGLREIPQRAVTPHCGMQGHREEFCRWRARRATLRGELATYTTGLSLLSDVLKILAKGT